MSRNYRIFATKRFEADLALLARHRMVYISEKLADYVYPQLKKEPHAGLNIKRLKNWDPPAWRYRVSDWRFLYVIDEETRVVSMIAASHRKSAY